MGTGQVNRQVVLARRPASVFETGDLRIEPAALPPPGPAEIRVRTRLLSVDPFTRLYLDEHLLGGTTPGLALGAVLPGAAVGEVVESRTDGFAPGDLVEGRIGWRETAVMPAAGLRRLDPSLGPAEAALGVTGLPGLTAHTGMITIGGIAPGQTVIVSSAAGSVGLIAGQIGKVLGARVVGIAGGPDKCRLALEHGFDACLDHRAPGLADALDAACPGGADLYFDNVGGVVSIAAYGALRRGATVALCGLLSLYQGDGGAVAADLGRLMRLIMNRGLTVRAFATFESVAPGAGEALAAWWRSGAVRLPQTIVEGIDAAPAAFAQLLAGGFRGKLLVRLS